VVTGGRGGEANEVAMIGATRRSLAALRESRVGRELWRADCLDIAFVVLAAPIVLLLGAPAAGYAIGSAAWALVRLVGTAVDRRAGSITHWSDQVALRLSYRSLRVLLLVAATVLALGAGGRRNGLTALAVIAVASALQLSASLRHASRSRLR
jgi:hypothetical protein